MEKILSKNCPNCAAPYDPNLIKCPYCGTIYLDIPALDVDEHKPVWIRVKHGNDLILHRAYLNSASFEMRTEDTNFYTTEKIPYLKLPSTKVVTTLEFVGSDDTLIIDTEEYKKNN